MVTLHFFAMVLAASCVSGSLVAADYNEKRDTAVTVLDDYDYVIVGSGAGGGPLAARLAIYGQKVLLLEAGDDEGATPYEAIPAFFTAASEYDAMSWDFFVRHYPNDTQEALNLKATYTTPEGETYIGLDPPTGSILEGIWYPRAATLGGCAAHNAMVTVYPFEEDWSLLQNLTGDASFSPDNMLQYWERIEQNQYLINDTDATADGHGFDGWLGTSEMPLDLMEQDLQLLAMLTAANTVMTGLPTADLSNIENLEAIFPLDLNTPYPDRDSTQGLYRGVMAVSDGVRSSPRELLLDTANATYANGTRMYHLDIRTHAFVTKIRFSDDIVPRALGVDFLDGESLYLADPRSGNSTGTTGAVNATKEVIISAGTFNTPQLLKLSGIGPRAELEQFNIPVVADLSGVGTNLLDHYEISTVVKFDTDFALLENCTWLSTADDPCYDQWLSNSTDIADRGPYATNLIAVAGFLESSIAAGIRDTFVFGGPFNFRGYYEGYSTDAVADLQHWSWSILKAHEKDFAGTVTLNSSNPLDMPNINFNFFEAGTTVDGAAERDIQPLVEAIQWSREVYGNLSSTYQDFTEEQPGANVTTTDEIKDYIRNQAWSHHAAGTAKMGSGAVGDVVDSHFRVFNVTGLRIVDASIFPQMPGFFPVTSVYMISEKAADVIVADNA